MHPCDPYREQMLESLYGLLEPGADEALRAHLSTCSVCQVCWQDAQKQRMLLSRAALCSSVEPFTSPLEITASETAAETSEVLQPSEVLPTSAPAILPMSTAPRRSWRRWSAVAAAAAVLFAAGSAWWYQHQRNDYRRQIASAARDVEAIDSQVIALGDDYKRKEKKITRQIMEEFTQVSVSGPAVVQAGAAATYQVTTRDAEGQPRPADVTVRWQGDDKREMSLKSDGDAFAQLPPGLAGRDGRATLEVETRAGGKTFKISEPIRVTAPTCVTHLATNKSAYRVGELLFFRTLTLERFNLKPSGEKIALRYTLLDSQGQPKITRQGHVGSDGVGGGELALTDKLAEGEYTLEVAQVGGQLVQPVRRKLEIRRGADPEVQFDKNHYRPGDYGVGTIILPGQPKNQPVYGSVHVDGKPVPTPGAAPGGGGGVNLQTDKDGKVAFPFTVPEEVEKEATLVLQQAKVAGKGKKAGKDVEDVARAVKKIPIPVIPSRLGVDFYPEGGELIEGIPTRVYYRVRTPQGEPADPDGHVILMGRGLGDEGMLDRRNAGTGVFEFTPAANEDYTLRVTWPKRGNGDWPSSNPFEGLIKKQGVALTVPVPVGRAEQALDVELRNVGSARQLLVMANVRGRVVDQRFVDVAASSEGKPGAAKVRLTPPENVGGLIRVTVYETNKSDLIPLAERLVYRAPARQLTLSATPRPSLSAEGRGAKAGERATLDILARDENGAPSPATILGLIVDQRAAPQGQPGLPAYFHLLAETGQDLDNADVIINQLPSVAAPFDLFSVGGTLARAAETARELHAALALDLYLGTQGWRSFVKQDSPALAKTDGDKGDAKAGVKGGADAPVMFRKESRQDYKVALQRAVDTLRQPGEQELQRLAAEAEESRRAGQAALLALADFEERMQRTLRLGLGGAVVLLLGVGCLFLAIGLIRLARQQASPRPALGFALVAVFSALVLYGVVGRRLDPTNPRAPAGALALLQDRAATNLPESQVGRGAARVAEDSLFFAAPTRPVAAAKAAASRQVRAESVASADPIAPPAGDDRGAADQLRLSPQLLDRFSEAEESAQSAEKKSAHPEKGTQDPATKLREATTFARKFAHNANSGKRDAQDTVLWMPNLTLPEAGAASVSFGLSGAPATYQILLYANSPSGRLGFYRGTIQAR